MSWWMTLGRWGTPPTRGQKHLAFMRNPGTLGWGLKCYRCSFHFLADLDSPIFSLEEAFRLVVLRARLLFHPRPVDQLDRSFLHGRPQTRCHTRNNTQYPSYFLDNESEIFLLSASKEWQDSILRHYSCNNKKNDCLFLWQFSCPEYRGLRYSTKYLTDKKIRMFTFFYCFVFYWHIHLKTATSMKGHNLLTMVRMKINLSCSLHILFANSDCCSMLNACRRPKSYEMIKPQLVDDWITLSTRYITIQWISVDKWCIQWIALSSFWATQGQVLHSHHFKIIHFNYRPIVLF